MKFDERIKYYLNEQFTLDTKYPISKKDFKKGEIIGIIKFGDKVTVFGKTVKVSKNNNVLTVIDGDKILATAKSDIKSGEVLSIFPYKSVIKDIKDVEGLQKDTDKTKRTGTPSFKIVRKQ